MLLLAAAAKQINDAAECIDSYDYIEAGCMHIPWFAAVLACRLAANKLNRFPGAPPAAAALVAAVAAQEATKILTQQFEPINNIFLWNGVERRGLTTKL